MAPALMPGSPALLYFSYGANMSSAVLRRRDVTPLAAQPAVLDPAGAGGGPPPCLSFRHRGGYATVGPPPPAGGTSGVSPAAPALWHQPVHGVLYSLAPGDLERLQRWEVGYVLHHQPVTSYAGARHPAVAVFESSPLLRLASPVPPAQPYLARILGGAREQGLAPEYIAWLEALEPEAVPLAVSRSEGRYSDTLAERLARGLAALAMLGAAWALTHTPP